MARALWNGYISFGLVNIPVILFPAESHFDLHFHLLDNRDHARIKYERINEETHEVVPWEEVVKAYEYSKDEFVIIDQKELEDLAAQNKKTIEIEEFVEIKNIDSVYFDKPYYLVPDKRGEKGYVLLHEILKETKKVGIAKVLIRTKEYLVALMPYQNALIINILRYPQELRKPSEFDIPSENPKAHKITQKELDLAKQLITSMTKKWQPSNYHDEYQSGLKQWIEKKIQAQSEGREIKLKKGKTKMVKTNVVDLMSLLKKSLGKKAVQTKSVAKKRSGNKKIAR